MTPAVCGLLNASLTVAPEPFMPAFLQKNIGPVDRGLRVVLGIGLLAVAFTGPQTPWGYLGVIPLLTATVGTCPLYSLFGLSTCRVPKS
jgi:hypothetical protein